MNRTNLIMAAAVAAVAAIGGVAVYLSSPDETAEGGGGEGTVVRVGGRKTDKSKTGRRRVKHASARKIEENVQTSKPDLSLDAEDAEKLSGEFKELYDALKAAFDAEDMAAVRKLVKRLQGMPEWPDGVPRSVKLAALEALAWFGPECLSDALAFLGDADVEITDAAIEAYEDMFMELEIGDRAVAEMVTQLAKIVHNTEALELFIDQMNEMRNSVKVQTALAIWDSGNQDAINVLKENMDSIFDDNDGDYEIQTREDIVKYGEDNPDDPDDEETYGPPADDDDSGSDEVEDDDDSATTSLEQYLKENPDEDIVISVSPDAM